MLLDSSLALAAQRVRLFQCVKNSKVPAIKNFSKNATSDPEELKRLFSSGEYNSGIACGFVAEGWHLVGLDIDSNAKKNGYKTIDDLDMLGLELPETWSQKTGSGGEHRLYWSPIPIMQGVNVLGPGVDLRSDGGYLIGPGSIVNGKEYTELKRMKIAMAPDWLISKYKKTNLQKLVTPENAEATNQRIAERQAFEFLNSIPVVLEGERNAECFKVITRLKDFGLNKDAVLNTLLAHWKCEPMLEENEIITTINSAYSKSQNAKGVLAPENIFDVIPTESKEEQTDYIDDYNKRFFYIAANGASLVCEEKKIGDKEYLERYSLDAFHTKMLPQTIKKQTEEKTTIIQKSKMWIKSERRREFEAMRFWPHPTTPDKMYNLFKGFHSKAATDIKPYSKEARTAFDNFVKHCKENICNNDESAYEWLMNFTAHLFQKPWEKPPVALVFQGRKGTGKSFFADVLRHMIGGHSVSIPNRTTMTNHFNSILEDKLLMVLEETFFSGDRVNEGMLKDHITATTRNIEHKNEKPYEARVYERNIIIGNDDRLVNATSDERRFAVFNVSDGKRGDTEFFGAIREGLNDHKADELLMKFFMDRDISKFNIRKAPDTEGLRDQKALSRTDFENWWHECLSYGRIINDPAGGTEWPKEMSCADFRRSFLLYFKEHAVSKYEPSEISIGKQFKRAAPSCASPKQIRDGAIRVRKYEFCPLTQARQEWEEATGTKEIWE